MRWLEGITDTTDMGLGGLWEFVFDREACAIHGVTKSRTRLSNWTELNWYIHLLYTKPEGKAPALLSWVVLHKRSEHSRCSQTSAEGMGEEGKLQNSSEVTLFLQLQVNQKITHFWKLSLEGWLHFKTDLFKPHCIHSSFSELRLICCHILSKLWTENIALKELMYKISNVGTGWGTGGRIFAMSPLVWLLHCSWQS